MFRYLTNSYTAKDGGDHPNAIVLVTQLRVLPLIPTAYVEVSYFHDILKAIAGTPIYPILNYEFVLDPPAGKHDYAAVFTGTSDSLNLFNYLSGLPEFSGWTPAVSESHLLKPKST